MGWYQDKAFPKLMQLNIGKPSILQKRKSLLQRVQGNILEIGIGEGTNLPLYPNHITNITAIDAYPRHEQFNWRCILTIFTWRYAKFL